MIRAILFDYGGTLDTDGVHWSEKFWELYQRLKVPVQKREFERAYVAAESRVAQCNVERTAPLSLSLGLQVSFQMEYLQKEGLFEGKVELAESVSALVKESYRDVVDNVKLARGVLQPLRSQYILGVVSNFTGNLVSVLDELGIKSLFHTVIDSEIVKVSKPDPQIFRIAMEQTGVDARECLVIGDSYDRDILPAKSLGCSTVLLFKRSWKEPGETPGADFRISSLAELAGLLPILNRSA